MATIMTMQITRTTMTTRMEITRIMAIIMRPPISAARF